MTHYLLLLILVLLYSNIFTCFSSKFYINESLKEAKLIQKLLTEKKYLNALIFFINLNSSKYIKTFCYVLEDSLELQLTFKLSKLSENSKSDIFFHAIFLQQHWIKRSFS